jgi:hypothetical protein
MELKIAEKSNIRIVVASHEASNGIDNPNADIPRV